MKHNFFHLTKNNQVTFFKEGNEYYQEYIKLIKNAKNTIHLQTYIFNTDEFGTLVQKELINATLRGVTVYLLVDSVGSRLLELSTENELKNAGIHFYRFNSIHLKWIHRWGRRLHHKILLIDHEVAFVGGINVISSSFDNSNIPQLDFALLLKGPVTTKLAIYCQKTFTAASKKKINFPFVKQNHNGVSGIDVKILVNDWVFRRWQITRQYTQLTQKAKNEITIINSYFFPRKAFMKKLVEASKRGVRVRLILPKYSDWPSYILASEYLYSYFLKNNVEIYRWNKSVLHGKLATIDDHWCTIGSFNLNYTSYQQNLEMNVNIYSHDFASTLKNEIEDIINNGCEQINTSDFIEKCSIKIQAQRFFYYVILSTIANLSIGLIYQEDNDKQNRYINYLKIIAAIFFFILGIIGAILPIIPGIPFFIISFLLVYKQLLLNKNKE